MYAKTAHKKPTSALLMLIIAMCTPLLQVSCKKKFPCNPPAGTACTITLDRFLEDCNTTVNGNIHIPYTGKLIIRYYDGCTGEEEDFYSYDIQSPTTAQKQPITIQATVPVRGPYWIEVKIQGEQCSMCASGWGGTNDNSVDHCNAIDVPGGKRVAIPQWHGFYTVQTVTSTLSITNIPHTFNVPNSCGCVVPY